MFCNLFFLKEFRGHNFSDFWVGSTAGAQIYKISDEELSAYLKHSFLPPPGGDLPPDFEPILPLTLSPRSCASFMRTYPQWPYDERDYYLSKLYQFLLMVLDQRFRLYETSRANEVGLKVENVLNLIPREMLPPGRTVNWYRFWLEIWNAAVASTIDETLEVLEISIADILELTEDQLRMALDEEGRPTRRYGPEPDLETHKRVYEIVSKYENWKESGEL